MFCSAARRVINTAAPHRLAIRRYLATETSNLPPLPYEPSPEFAKILNEERGRRGIHEDEVQRDLSDEEKQAEFDAFLERQKKIKPERKQLNVEVDAEHGLWAFFRKVKKGDTMQYETVEPTMSQLTSGRAWTAAELRRKSFKDLHTLWYIVLRERNLLATQKQEAKRMRVPKSAIETTARDRECRLTMARIKQVLNERRRAYEDACDIRRSESAEATLTITPEEGITSSEASAVPQVETEQSMINKLRYERKGRRIRVVRPNAIEIARANAFRLTQPSSEGGLQNGGSTIIADSPATHQPDTNASHQPASSSQSI